MGTKTALFSPGQTCPKSGQWGIYWVSNGVYTGRERTVVKGEPFPPTPSAGQGYALRDATRT